MDVVMRCSRCNGQGRYLGNGFMMTDCHVCLGDGCLPNPSNEEHISNESVPKLAAIDKRSKLYKDSIKDIMAVNPKISKDDAEKMFDKAYEKG